MVYHARFSSTQAIKPQLNAESDKMDLPRNGIYYNLLGYLRLLNFAPLSIGTKYSQMANWGQTARGFQNISPITGGEADYFPAWTSRLLELLPFELGFIPTRVDYVRTLTH